MIILCATRACGSHLFPSLPGSSRKSPKITRNGSTSTEFDLRNTIRQAESRFEAIFTDTSGFPHAIGAGSEFSFISCSMQASSGAEVSVCSARRGGSFTKCRRLTNWVGVLQTLAPARVPPGSGRSTHLSPVGDLNKREGRIRGRASRLASGK